MSANPEQPILDAIDELVDWQLEDGRRRGEYQTRSVPTSDLLTLATLPPPRWWRLDPSSRVEISSAPVESDLDYMDMRRVVRRHELRIREILDYGFGAQGYGPWVDLCVKTDADGVYARTVLADDQRVFYVHTSEMPSIGTWQPAETWDH